MMKVAAFLALIVPVLGEIKNGEFSEGTGMAMLPSWSSELSVSGR